MSNTLEQLNQLTSAAPIADPAGTFTPHPLGGFNGVIESIVKKKVKLDNRPDECPIYEVVAKTAYGTAQYTIWGYTQHDVSQIMQGGQARELFDKTMGRLKRLFVDLGVWTEDLINQSPVLWHGDRSPAVLNDMHQLQGKRCWVAVLDSLTHPGDPKKRTVFLNAPRDNMPDQPQQAAQGGLQGPPTAHDAPPLGMPPNGAAQPPGPQFQQPPAGSANLDDIPF